jgi:voltage-gated potassium channel
MDGVLDRTTHLIITILLSIFLVAIGTAGYMLIEGWTLLDSLYMTVITFSTVGFGEINQISPAGRIFTLFLIIMGAGFILYVIGNVIQFLVEGRIRIILGRRKMDKEIGRLTDHYVVCGYGRVGRAFCRYLRQRQLPFVVIERSTARSAVMDQDHVLYVQGEATLEENLNKAGIGRASNLIAALGTDADNVLLVLLARGLKPGLFIVARASQNATKKPLYVAGANAVVSPFDIGARRMAHAILRPHVIRFLELAFADEATDIHIEEVEVAATSNLVNLTLEDSEIRKNYNVIVLSIFKPDGTVLFNPSAGIRFESGDTIVLVGAIENLRQLHSALNP